MVEFALVAAMEAESGRRGRRGAKDERRNVGLGGRGKDEGMKVGMNMFVRGEAIRTNGDVGGRGARASGAVAGSGRCVQAR